MKLRILATAALAFFSLQHSAFAAPALKNGVGLHAPMTWGRTTPDHSDYQWPVYADARYDLPTDLLRQVKAAGFDFVRLTVDPGPFLAARDQQRTDLDQRLLTTVKQIQAIGLDVLVDFHPISMVKTYAPDRIESEALFPAYSTMVGQTAKLISSLGTDHVAIEPMNEPQMGYDMNSQRRWQGMMEHLYNDIHTNAPNLTVIVSGGRGGSIEGLLNIDPKPFAAGPVRYSFHYYLPYIFTHEGVNNQNKKARLWLYTTGLPYPASPSDEDRFKAIVVQRVNSAPNVSADDKAQILNDGIPQLDEYFKGKGTQAAIVADFDRVSGWAQANHIDPSQLFIGEFGVTQEGPSYHGANPDDRARWLTDVRQEADKRGYSWSMWNLSGKSSNGMILVSPTDQTKIDPVTAKALGKTL